jgi:release factor glutamine methyltransferase
MRDLATAAADAARHLERSGWARDTAARDAALLARHALGWTAEAWLTRQREHASDAFHQAFDALITRRSLGEPIAYLTGEREFYGRPFHVTQAVLIPRPETELVVEAALDRLPDGQAPLVVDVGTGSGCLAITIALERAQTRVIATDISQRALDVARANAARLGADRVEFRRASLLEGIVRADLIVSNPPYVAERDRASLAREVAAFEPSEALFGGDDGFEIIRQLLPAAARTLTEGGALVMEIGAGQAGQIAELFDDVPALKVVEIRRDLQQIPRCVIAERRSVGA